MKPLFCGQSEVDQITQILRTLGNPSEEEWPNKGKVWLVDVDQVCYSVQLKYYSLLLQSYH
jgi:hypothetical protein